MRWKIQFYQIHECGFSMYVSSFLNYLRVKRMHEIIKYSAMVVSHFFHKEPQTRLFLATSRYILGIFVMQPVSFIWGYCIRSFMKISFYTVVKMTKRHIKSKECSKRKKVLWNHECKFRILPQCKVGYLPYNAIFYLWKLKATYTLPAKSKEL